MCHWKQVVSIYLQKLGAVKENRRTKEEHVWGTWPSLRVRCWSLQGWHCRGGRMDLGQQVRGEREWFCQRKEHMQRDMGGTTRRPMRPASDSKGMVWDESEEVAGGRVVGPLEPYEGFWPLSDWATVFQSVISHHYFPGPRYPFVDCCQVLAFWCLRLAHYFFTAGVDIADVTKTVNLGAMQSSAENANVRDQIGKASQERWYLRISVSPGRHGHCKLYPDAEVVLYQVADEVGTSGANVIKLIS